MRIIILNGPPDSGKDAAGKLIVEVMEARGKRARIVKFAQVLKERTHALYGLTHGGAPLLHDAYEDEKDLSLGDFLGITPRQAYIAVSEKLLKPLHGKEVFGYMLLDTLLKLDATTDLFVITDGGFVEEAAPLVTTFGAKKIRLFQIYRDGKTFDGDSRSYYEIPGVETFRIENNGTLAQLKELFETWRG